MSVYNSIYLNEMRAMLYRRRARLTVKRSVCEDRKRLPRLRFGLLWDRTNLPADGIAAPPIARIGNREDFALDEECISIRGEPKPRLHQSPVIVERTRVRRRNTDAAYANPACGQIRFAADGTSSYADGNLPPARRHILLESQNLFQSTSRILLISDMDGNHRYLTALA
jgi:hypothetical protein